MALAPARHALGAPSIRVVPPEPVRELTGVRRDVAAFVGVAPRGPAWLPPATLEPDVDLVAWLTTTRRRRSVAVTVTSWDEYRHHFGGFEGPGRLPYAVSTFFAAGGERAEVVRLVHAHADRFADAAGRAHGRLRGLRTTAGQAVALSARSEGTWGNRLRGTLRFSARPLAVTVADPSRLLVDPREWVPGGSLLRLRLADDVQELRYVSSSVEEPDPAGPSRRRLLTLDAAVAGVPVGVEVVTATLEVADHDPTFARHESLGELGLHPDHPRWLARALVLDSTLLWPHESWAASPVVLTDPNLPPVTLVSLRPTDPLDADLDPGAVLPLSMADGADLWDVIVPEDHWDPRWVPGDEVPGDGVHCLADHDDVGLVVAPDLYEPVPLVEPVDVTDPPTLCGPDFAVHVETAPVVASAPPPPGLTGLSLDPLDPLQLARIVAAQQALVEWADARRDLTVLLDVPLGLTSRQALDWRTRFDSPFAAAYHPWVDVSSADDARDALVRLNPAAFAAGIIAERERRLGVQHGPANQLAAGAVRVSATVGPDDHDALHVAGIDVFLPDRDGVRLTGARTLSRRPSLRQLSVVRLMTVLRLTLEREMQWAVFEPNDAELWAEVRRLVHGLLRRLFEAGAFRGATTKEAFFVTCDRTTMTQNDIDAGRLVCLVGVAPAEPVEHLVLEMALAAASGVRVEVRG